MVYAHKITHTKSIASGEIWQNYKMQDNKSCSLIFTGLLPIFLTTLAPFSIQRRICNLVNPNNRAMSPIRREVCPIRISPSLRTQICRLKWPVSITAIIIQQQVCLACNLIIKI